MSGGTDSSFAALLLKKRGYDVEGFTLKMVEIDSPNDKSCCSQTAIERAARVCEKLKIPHNVLYATAEFKEKIILDNEAIKKNFK